VTSLTRRTVCGWLAAPMMAATLIAQARDGVLPVPETTARTFKSTVDLVTLNVTVTDRRNRPVPGLARGDFEVLEDGVAQEVSFFAASDVPIDVALLIDSSSSMRGKLPLVEQAAAGFVATLRPNDRAAVMPFSTQLRVAQPFTSDKAALTASIHAVNPRGNTALYTSLYVALDGFERARREAAASGQPTVRRSAIVVLTDGEDTASAIQLDDVLERARRGGVAIYPISIIDENSDITASERRFYRQPEYALRTLAKETGAQAFFPTQLKDLNGVYQAVAQELSQQYALGYSPKINRTDGSFRRVSVLVVDRPDARPRTRTGYYAAGPVRASNVR
jgi:Ca-activated chloride channel homolog